MTPLQTSRGSIILNGAKVDYLYHTDGAGFSDIQVRRGRLTTKEKAYDFSFILAVGGEGLKACEKKFPGLLALLAKRFPDLNIVKNTNSSKVE